MQDRKDLTDNQHKKEKPDHNLRRKRAAPLQDKIKDRIHQRNLLCVIVLLAHTAKNATRAKRNSSESSCARVSSDREAPSGQSAIPIAGPERISPAGAGSAATAGEGCPESKKISNRNHINKNHLLLKTTWIWQTASH